MTVAHSRLPGWTGFALPRRSARVTTIDAVIMPIMKPEEPFTVFTKGQKHWLSLSASFSAMFSTMSSYIYYPALVPVARDLKLSVFLINLTITSYLLTAAIAPAFMGDMADQSGRRPIFLLMFVLMIGANVGIALQRLTAITYGVISDITLPKDRGGFVGVLLLLQVHLSSSAVDCVNICVNECLSTDIAPSLGPVIGGSITQELGWRWIFWFLVIVISITTLTMLLFFPETQRNIVGNGSARVRGIYWSFFTLISNRSQKTNVRVLKNRSSLVVILLYGITYSVKMTLQTSLGAQCVEIYKLDYLTTGLIYIPSGVAGGIGSFITGRILNRNYRRATSKLTENSEHKSTTPSEVQIEQIRLKGLYYLFTISALGTVGYGLALMTRAFITGITTASLFTMTGTLLTDLNCERSATAQGASSIVRCLGAGAAIAALQPLADAAGLGWCFAVYALLLATELPLAWIICRKGPDWRKQHKS
ncbi:major facilitator superfamily domain-containing protein [Colletotrichum phormii]|uniref:Major facilitator superfamily domain-containing protein n=1 Tax=Colletotrichum phormii TaxID=359342 RepID=A0AAI9ZGD5_9PEZI|nr:major facilitator superfamily domain-containing protein [Colletotrichum phormii]KAK1624087.1 major facilitator superfamily domain-containing protein [Colletotrichum phormii]